MKISAKIDYACRALLELSLYWPNETPLQINLIAKSQDIPIKFLTQILINLKQMGYVKSIRGKSGGYLLAKSPETIRLSVLVRNMSPTKIINEVSHEEGVKKHVMNVIWEEVDSSLFDIMDQFTFEFIAQRQRRQDNVVMFEI